MLIAHGIIYAACMATMLFIGVERSRELMWVWALVSISHFVADYLKRYITWKPFSVDQIIHCLFLITAWRIWGRYIQIKDFEEYDFPYFPGSGLAALLGVLLILRPIGLLIEKGDIWDFGDKTSDASRMIGYLERIVVFFLLIRGQYAAIGFVITAKSVARFPEIGKDGEGRLQAEYYFIGTMLSMVFVFMIALVLGLLAPPEV